MIGLNPRRRTGQPPPSSRRSHRRKRPQSRKVNAILAGCSLLAGFGITAAILHVVRASGPQDDRGLGAAQAGPAASDPVRSADAGQSPAALDAQWLSYSDHASCADWAGGDGVSAIRISPSQIAWFFADTFLGPAGPTTGFSHTGGFLHNSVVMQTSAGGRTSLVTLTGGGGCASQPAIRPAASVVQASTTAAGPQRYWDADGIKVGGTVVKFYNSYLLGPIPFVPTGTTIARFPVGKLSTAGRGQAHSQVIAPKLTPVPAYTPPGGGTPIVWGSALLRSGGDVYVYGWQSPSAASPKRLLYLARVGAARLADFAAWQFYAGGTWAGSQSQAVPIEPATQHLVIASAFSVVPIAGRYWLIQAAGGGDAAIDAYPAANPWGPFEAQRGKLLYQAPGIGLTAANDYRVLYEARAEPALSTSKTVVISYNVNSEAVTSACMSILRFTNAITQPRFITLPTTAFATSAPNVEDLVSAAPAAYPHIVEQHPAQWYDAWSFSGGCPPVPRASDIAARTGPGQVRLTWRSAGIGVQYRIYVGAGSGALAYRRTVSAAAVALTGLTSGLTYQVEIVPISVHDNAGPAGRISVRIP